MKLETFFEKFDQFADAPDAVAKMRELIMWSAFSGAFSAEERNQPMPEEWAVEGAPTLPAIPSSWKWQRGSEVFDVIRGVSYKKNDASASPVEGSFPVLRANNIGNGINFDGLVYVPRDNIRDEQFVRRGDILIAMSSGSKKLVGKAAPIVTNFIGAFGAFCGIIRNKSAIPDEVLARYFQSPQYTSWVTAAGRGIGINNLGKGDLDSLPVPTPPLAEQKRIVAKVDELMALCDRLEAQQQERETQHAALARASLARFADAPTPANLPFLFHPSYPIPPAHLRKSILTLAVQGKLVPQDPNDEPAEEESCGKKSEKIEAVSENEKLFPIPPNWMWWRLGTIGIGSTGKTPPTKNPENYGGQIPFIGPGQITPTGNLLPPEKFLSEVGIENSVEALPGDVLMVCIGGSIGKSAICRERLSFNQQINSVRPISLTTEFTYIAFRSFYFQEQVAKRATGSATPIINRGKWEEIPIPVPPLAEQRRIVAKVDQLMALVDALETQLAASRATAANLLSALVAELTGTGEISNRAESSKGTVTMKAKANVSAERREQREPLKLSTKSFVLRRFAMSSGYRSLGEFDCTYHSEEAVAEEASPIVLVGLNGSGKSNLIEAAAEVFCFLELINLPWKKVASSSSRYRANRHLFELEYTLEDDRGKTLVRVRKTKKSNAEFYTVSQDGSETPVEAGRSQLLLLPRRIIGYSSGLNETVSHPFLRTKTIYSEEVRDAAPPEGEEASEDAVFDTGTLYMDYESNAAILISNYIFQKSADLAIIKEFTRVKGVSSFGLRFNRKRAGKSGRNSIVRLTSELKTYLRSFAICAGAKYDDQQIAYDLRFEMDRETTELFRQEFNTAENLFMAMHKWSLLNALILSDEQRNVYLSSDITKGALERPPSVPPSDRVFNIFDLTLRLSEPAVEIDYSGLSDGEHQFIQVFGTALLFSAPGTLFLFDEPESHFNPEWRTKFNLILNRLPNASRQEYVISTHSPFIVSGSRMGNVYKFTRTGGDISCAPVTFETYGAAFDDLLKKLFSVNSLIDQSAREELEEIIKEGDVGKMQDAVEDFAESKEKRRLYEALIKKEG